MATSVMRRVFEHRADSFPQGGDLSMYFLEETVLRTFEEPVAGDFIEVISLEGELQTPERLTSEARSANDRMPKGTKAGRIDHGEVTMKMEIRPPAALGGTDYPMGWKIFKALFGEARIVNTQTKVAVDSIQAHTSAGTKIRITAGEEDFQLGDGIAIRSRNTFSSTLDHEQALISLVEFPGGGEVDLTLTPQLTVKPFVTGATPDQIQGGVTFKPTKAWAKTFSALWVIGFTGEQVEGSVVANGQANFDARSILTADFGIHYRKAVFGAIGFVRGESGTDAFLVGDTVLDVDDASLYSVGQFVNLYKYNPATEALILKEEKAKVTDRDTTSSPNTLTLARGTTPVSETAAPQGLTCVTTATEEQLEGITTSVAGDFIAIELDHRGLVEVPLQVQATYTITHLVADVNDYLVSHEDYGHASDVIDVSGIDYGSCASDESGMLRLTSQAFGAQSYIRAVDTGKAGDQFDEVWTPAVDWAIQPDSGIQIEPWHPEGTNSLDTIENIDGICRALDAKFLFATATATFGNLPEHIEDVRTKRGDHYETGHLAGLARIAQIAVAQPAFGWTERLRNMAIDNTGIAVQLTTGNSEGGTFGWHVTKASVGGVSKSGANRVDAGYTLTGEDPGVQVTAPTSGTVYTLRECYAFIT